jgi:hypothetical protein
MLAVNRQDLSVFVEVLFRYCDPGGHVALRAFRDDADGMWRPDLWSAPRVSAQGLGDVVNAAIALAEAAGASGERVVVCPPVATFKGTQGAAEKDILNGPALSDCDQMPERAREILENTLGPATVVVASGGIWIDPETGARQHKVHVHWRLDRPTRVFAGHVKLKEARRLAMVLVGADASGVPLVHPLRWPGSLHTKVEPRLARIVSLRADVEIALDTALEQLRSAVAARATPGNGHDPTAGGYTGTTGHRPSVFGPDADAIDFISALSAIPNTERNRKRWSDIGMATWGASNGSAAGLAAFIAWTAKFEGNTDPNEKARERWEHWRRFPPSAIGAGTLFRMAREAWPGWEKPSDAQRRRSGDPGEPPRRVIEPPTDDGELAEGMPQLEEDPPPKDGDGDAELTEEQIERRRAEIVAAMAATLAALNQHFAVVNESGRCLVMKRTRDPAFDGRAMLERISFDDFTRMYANRRIEVIIPPKNPVKGGDRIIRRRLAPWWLEHPKRRQYLGGVTFTPTSRTPANFLNLWRGFAVKPAPGDWALMKDHILKILCRGEPADNDYVLNWLARLVQRPEEPGEVALVIRSTEKGTGKSLFGRYVVRLFGHHGMHVTHPEHLTGRFNAHLHDCCVLFADEAFFAGDKAHEGTLKGLITEHVLTIEGKYRNAVTVRNLLHVLIASNRDWVVPASIDERRFAVFEALDTRRGDRAYFAAIVKEMDNGGLAAMLHELLHRDISGFEVRDIPQTEALKTQKALSLSSLERWWLAVLERGFLWKSRHGAPWFTDMSSIRPSC